MPFPLHLTRLILHLLSPTKSPQAYLSRLSPRWSLPHLGGSGLYTETVASYEYVTLLDWYRRLSTPSSKSGGAEGIAGSVGRYALAQAAGGEAESIDARGPSPWIPRQVDLAFTGDPRP